MEGSSWKASRYPSVACRWLLRNLQPERLRVQEELHNPALHSDAVLDGILIGRLSLRLGDRARATEAAAAALRAEAALASDSIAAAVRLIDDARTPAWFGWAVSADIWSRPEDRYLQSLILMRAGRTIEAKRWLNSLWEHSANDLVYTRATAKFKKKRVRSAYCYSGQNVRPPRR